MFYVLANSGEAEADFVSQTRLVGQQGGVAAGGGAGRAAGALRGLGAAPGAGLRARPGRAVRRAAPAAPLGDQLQSLQGLRAGRRQDDFVTIAAIFINRNIANKIKMFSSFVQNVKIDITLASSNDDLG